jgi:L-arabinose transport system ATP-binding protein
MAFLEFRGIDKFFPGVRALDGINLSAAEGSVHALMGENGAGKSTLLKILSGAYTPTHGQVVIDGTPHVFASTGEALDAGVAVIYQELHLVPEMTVAENLFLGHLPAQVGVVKRGDLMARAAKQLALVGEDIDPSTRLGRLPIGQRQMVEIAKALTRGAKIIAFDEPTSSLSAREIKNLFRVIRELKAQGKVILYVTHRMEEVFEICDAVTVFRDGKHVETFATMSGVNHDVLVNRMVGRDIRDVYGWHARERGDAALEVRGIAGPGLAEPASLRVARGEILGLFGLVGAGRTELMKLIYGAVRKDTGDVLINGERVRIATPHDAIDAGLMLCPEDRKKEGIVPIRNIVENCNISARRNHAISGIVINEPWELQNVLDKIKALNVRTPSHRQLIKNLSGGNQQKVILGRWLSENIKVLMLDEPTRGIDVGAKREIYDIMYSLTSKGIGIVMVSSDLPEVIGVADRILVMRLGRISAELKRQEATPETVMKYALPQAAGENAA